MLAGGGGAGEREPVVGDGEGRKEEAAEEDLFKERREQGAEGGDEPDVGCGAEEVVHGDVFGHGRERGDGLDGEGEDDADGDEAEGVAAGGVGVGLEAFGEGALPEEREDEPREGEGGEVGEASEPTRSLTEAFAVSEAGWLRPKKTSWVRRRKKPVMARKRAAWPRWGMRTGGSGGGVPRRWGRRWSGLPGWRADGRRAQ